MNKNDFEKPGVLCQMLCTSDLKTSYINFSITLYHTFIIGLISAAQAVKGNYVHVVIKNTRNINGWKYVHSLKMTLQISLALK